MLPNAVVAVDTESKTAARRMLLATSATLGKLASKLTPLEGRTQNAEAETTAAVARTTQKWLLP